MKNDIIKKSILFFDRKYKTKTKLKLGISIAIFPEESIMNVTLASKKPRYFGTPNAFLNELSVSHNKGYCSLFLLEDNLVIQDKDNDLLSSFYNIRFESFGYFKSQGARIVSMVSMI